MMIESRIISTSRIRQHVLYRKGSGKTLLFIHGNGSSSVFWKEMMRLLPADYSILAPDLRGYGDTEAEPIRATLGLRDVADDIIALLDACELDTVHVAGHSLGGNVCYKLFGMYPERFESAVMVNPGSPYGFGGSTGEEGKPSTPDFAGSGGGVANPEFVKRLADKDRSEDDPNSSPRSVMNAFYWHPPFRPANEEELLDGVLSMKTGHRFYPGDFESTDRYPFVKPGKWGPINAVSPAYVGTTVTDFIGHTAHIPVLWVRGSEDLIVSDRSLFDLGTLGKMGLIPNYPGEDVYPPQPMVSQTRAVLERRGNFKEVVMEGTGHSPYIEQPQLFIQHVTRFWNEI
ncbi:MAG: alpha/beta hydrolase [Bacteroidota bacterium]